MAWTAVVSTLLGAVVGLLSVLLADRVRWQRERAERWSVARREVYAAYLAALQQAGEGLRIVSLGHGPAGTTRDAAARAAFRDAALVPAREQVVLTAPADVVHAADEAFRHLRALRVRVGEGQDVHSPGYREDLERFHERLHALRNAVRTDLGIAPLPDPLPP